MRRHRPGMRHALASLSWPVLLLAQAACATVPADRPMSDPTSAARHTSTAAAPPTTDGPPSPTAPVASGPTGGAPRDADGRFRNHGDAFAPKTLAEVLRWRWRAWRDDLPPPPQAPTPRVQPDLDAIHAQARDGGGAGPLVTWIGHATTLVQAGGLAILTDPIFSERASPVSFAGPRRHVPPGIALAQLPRVDVVLVSHNHYDHLDGASVDALARQPGGSPLFVVPLGLRAWFADRGIDRVTELDWWQSVTVGATEIVLTPVQHWSGRGLGDRMATLWGGWAVFAPDCHWFFAGDTGYSRDFAAAHARFAARHGGPGRGFDLALIPIGAYAPRWFMAAQHVDPAEAVRIHRDLVATRSLGVHWGTFTLTDEALDEPPRALERALGEANVAADAFVTVPIGASIRLAPRAPR